jgi:hypothetical protein
VGSVFREPEAQQRHGTLQQQKDPLVSVSACNNTTHLRKALFLYSEPRIPYFCFPLQPVHLSMLVSLFLLPSANTQHIYARPRLSPERKFPCFSFPLQTLNIFMQGSSPPRTQISLFLLPSANTQHIYARPFISLSSLSLSHTLGSLVSSSFHSHSRYLCKASCSSPDPRFPCFCFPLQTIQLMQGLASLSQTPGFHVSAFLCKPFNLCKASCLSPRPQVSMFLLPFANHSTYARPRVSLLDPRFPCFCFLLRTTNLFMQGLPSLSRTPGFPVYASLWNRLTSLCKSSCLSRLQVTLFLPHIATT